VIKPGAMVGALGLIRTLADIPIDSADGKMHRSARPLKAAQLMRSTDPLVAFLLVLVVGVVAGLLFDRLAGPSWLARQFSGSSRGIVTSTLVGVAGAFVGYHIAILLALGGGLITSLIAAAAGAAAVLFAWRMVR
jgi:uncharacterized membrane protein YeaQ/YmgE (transglycosylase-associated protein family)